MCESEQRQAGAFEQIEVTSEMIAAGLDELRERHFDDGLSYVLESVYRAMAYARPSASATNSIR